MEDEFTISDDLRINQIIIDHPNFNLLPHLNTLDISISNRRGFTMLKTTITTYVGTLEIASQILGFTVLIEMGVKITR